MSNATTEYPADRLGNTNPIASAVKEVVGAHDDAPSVAPAIVADRSSTGRTEAGSADRGERKPAASDRSDTQKASQDTKSGSDDTASQSQDQGSQSRSRAGDRSNNTGAKVDAMRAKAADLTDQVVAYTRDEPVKALLLAAAVGALLMTLLGSVGRSRD